MELEALALKLTKKVDAFLKNVIEKWNSLTAPFWRLKNPAVQTDSSNKTSQSFSILKMIVSAQWIINQEIILIKTILNSKFELTINRDHTLKIICFREYKIRVIKKEKYFNNKNKIGKIKSVV
jgi:hypothetical protein